MSRDLSDNACYQKAQARGDITFTVVGQDVTSPSIVCEWIRQNIYSCPEDKLREALNRAIAMRNLTNTRNAD